MARVSGDPEYNMVYLKALAILAYRVKARNACAQGSLGLARLGLSTYMLRTHEVLQISLCECEAEPRCKSFAA